jgi:Tfx family DNA-binding protein
MVKEKTGALTKTQIEVLRLRIAGLTQEETANRLGTTRQNISLVERRAKNNLKKAEETLAAYRRLSTVASITIPSSTHMVDVPRMLIDAADSAGVRISGDFSLVYKELKHSAGDNISGSRIIKPIRVDVLKDGNIYIEPS